MLGFILWPLAPIAGWFNEESFKVSYLLINAPLGAIKRYS